MPSLILSLSSPLSFDAAGQRGDHVDKAATHRKTRRRKSESPLSSYREDKEKQQSKAPRQANKERPENRNTQRTLILTVNSRNIRQGRSSIMLPCPLLPNMARLRSQQMTQSFQLVDRAFAFIEFVQQIQIAACWLSEHPN